MEIYLQMAGIVLAGRMRLIANRTSSVVMKPPTQQIVLVDWLVISQCGRQGSLGNDVLQR